VFCPSGFYSLPSTSSQCHLSLSDRMTQLNDSTQGIQGTCYACPAHARCVRALVSPAYNYYLLWENPDAGDFSAGPQIILCPRGYCQPIRSESSSSPWCSHGRTGPLCTGCDRVNNRVTSLRFDDVIDCPGPRDGRCLDNTSSFVVIFVFSIIYVVMLLLLVRLLLTNRNHHATPLVNSNSHMTDGSALIGHRHCSPLVSTGHVADNYSSLSGSEFPANADRVVDNRSSIGCVSPANSGHVTDNRWHIGSDIPASTANHVTDNRPPIGCASPACSGHVMAGRSLIGCVLALVFFHQLLPSVYPRLMTSNYWWDQAIQFFISLFHLYPATGLS